MAVTLPNPSIVFVPLDVLTAEELNQMVQNTEFLAGLFPLKAANIADGAITSAKIGTDITPIGNVISLGTRKIMWGSATVPNAASGADTALTIPFPQYFGTTPTVTATVGSWVGLPIIIATSITTRNFKVVVNHQQGTPQNIVVNWIAIG